MATRNGKLYGVKCAWCGTMFSTRSSRAKYCRDSHRLAAHRANKTGDGRTLHDLSEQAIDRLQQILNISEPAYNTIFRLLETKGANTATEAIRAAYFVASELIEIMEREKR